MENDKHNKKKGKYFIYLLMFLGCALIVASVCIFIWWQVSIAKNAEKLKEYVAIINERLPETQSAVLEEKSDYSMAVLSIENNDFIGLLTFEKNKSVFPVCATWKDVNSFPCRLCGSVYDSTVIIGATEQKGQIDFTESIFVSDTITFTDMLGNCYSYRVEDIKNSNNADYKNLANVNSDMVLFIKRTYSQEYLIIECKNT